MIQVTDHRRPGHLKAESEGHPPRFSRPIRLGVALFVLLTCLHVWIGPVQILEHASAQIPDSGHQRKLLIDETRRTNQLLTEIAQILREQTLNVRIATADNQPAAPVLRSVRP